MYSIYLITRPLFRRLKYIIIVTMGHFYRSGWWSADLILYIHYRYLYYTQIYNMSIHSTLLAERTCTFVHIYAYNLLRIRTTLKKKKKLPFPKTLFLNNICIYISSGECQT